MDMDTLKENVKTVIGLMPAEVQLDCAKLFHIVVKHMPTIEKIGPVVVGILGNDVNTLAMEFAMGTLDKDRLNKTMTEAFAECGIVLPEISAPVGGKL